MTTKVGQRFIHKGYDNKFIKRTTKEVLDIIKKKIKNTVTNR